MSVALKVSGGFFQVPDVSQADINSFHDAHFSNAAVGLFDTQFFQPENAQKDDQNLDEYEEYYEEEEDDGLGYYPDGVKRTLTDEQIAIFRHSELEALRRVESKAVKLKNESVALLQAARDEDIARLDVEVDPMATSAPAGQSQSYEDKDIMEEGELQDGSEDGEIGTDTPKPSQAEIKRLKKLHARHKKRDQRKFNPDKKPDLRKRTWDVVEAGMDSLDYDELETGQDTTASHTAQRRRISYDD
ncbi:hypothetical protein F4677DRAFT_378087 [Hypoxylon crocopeplum]|nr:hypothetical protein F4677DRAFT_378087 [Hypoxylon crocopeplum]